MPRWDWRQLVASSSETEKTKAAHLILNLQWNVLFPGTLMVFFIPWQPFRWKGVEIKDLSRTSAQSSRNTAGSGPKAQIMTKTRSCIKLTEVLLHPEFSFHKAKKKKKKEKKIPWRHRYFLIMLICHIMELKWAYIQKKNPSLTSSV